MPENRFARIVLGEKDVLVDATGPQRIAAMLQQLGPTYVRLFFGPRGRDEE